eukprot:2199753-Prymnesium_polylepis.1
MLYHAQCIAPPLAHHVRTQFRLNCCRRRPHGSAGWTALMLHSHRGELSSRISLTAPLPRLPEPPCHGPWPGSSVARSVSRAHRTRSCDRDRHALDGA